MFELRFPEPADVQASYEAVRESIHELHRWMSWCQPTYSLSDSERSIAAQPQARADGTAFEFVIDGGNGRILGRCGLNSINQEYRIANLGYWVRTSETGRGLATQAALRLAAWGFANTNLERLEIVAAVGNLASQRVAEKTGALREGVLRSRLYLHGQFHDAVMYSLIRSGNRDATNALESAYCGKIRDSHE